MGLTDEELRRSLKKLGYSPGPITTATRELYEKKLSRLRAEARRSTGSPGINTGVRPEVFRRSWAAPPLNSERKRSPAWNRGREEEDDDDDDNEEEEEEEEDEEEEGSPTWNSSNTRAWQPPQPLASLHRKNTTPPQTRYWSPPPRPPPESTVHRTWAPPMNSSTRAWTSPVPPVSRTPPTPHSARQGWLRGPNDPPTPWARPVPAWDSEGEEEPRPPPRAPPAGSWNLWGKQEPPRSKLPPHRGPEPSCRPRALERILSRVLAAASVVLLCVFLAILWVKSAGPPAGESAEDNLKQMPMDCEGRTDPYCQKEQKKIVQQMLFELYNFLAKQAGSFECGNPDRLKSKCIPVEEAREFVANISGHPPEKFDLALERVINSNRDLGIWVRGNDPFSEPITTLDTIACLESTHPRLGLTCRLGRALSTAITNLILLFWALAFLWGVLALLKYRWRRMEEAEKAMYDMVKKITDVVRDHYIDWESGMETYPYIGVCHVRDTLIPHQNRKKMLPVWDKAVKFLEANDSRIRTESHCIAGEDMLVWRWARSAKYRDS